MTGETSKKQWWLVLRREGYETIKIRLPINWKPLGSELDGLVDPLELNQYDWEFYSGLTDLAGSPDDLKVRYEFVAITASHESTQVVID